jgi:hypothetical protein
MIQRHSPVRIGSDMQDQRRSDAASKTFSNKRRSDGRKCTFLKTSALRRCAIYAFILFHAAAILAWALPWSPRPLVIVRKVVRPYVLWTGLSQSWDTFGPNPRSVDIYAKAVVFRQSRHIDTFSFPRMEELSYGQRYEKERYRKFVENLLSEDNAPIWPDVTKHIAYLMSDPDNPPNKVVLIRFDAQIVPNSTITTAKPTIFYDDYVEPEDLK